MNRICKYCKQPLDENLATQKASPDGYFFICYERKYFKEMGHKPMDNLDYIEWLAKRRGLVL